MESEAGGNRETLMLARCLEYLILELPHDAGELVAIEVVECRADIYDMSHLYIDHMIRLCESCFAFDHHSSLIHF
jgi:hypothetical protein